MAAHAGAGNKLYQHPFIKDQDIKERINATFSAADQLMNTFVDHGLLVEVAGQAHNHQFRYGSYIELFN